MARFIFSHLRPAYGYEPGQEVSPEFAQQYPWLVTEVKNKPSSAPAKPGSESNKDGEQQ